MNRKNADNLKKVTLSELLSNISSNFQNDSLKINLIHTPISDMIAVADEKVLYLLEFMDRKGLIDEIKALQFNFKSKITEGITEPLRLIKAELELYFKGKLITFQTPFKMYGSPFKLAVLDKLLKIPFGKTYSYSDIAKLINQPKAYRAVAKANGSNQLAIIIPCHRVININKSLGGYSAGVKKKQWLLNHELRNARL